MKKIFFALIIIGILAISAYGYYDLINSSGGMSALVISDSNSNEIKNVHEENKFPEVYFTTYENITPILINLIENSNEIKCALYEISEPAILKAFKKKNAMIAVENDNYHGDFHTGNSSGEMHNKFCIFDNETIITGSTNLNFEGVYKNDNNLIVIHSRYIAKNYLDEFDEIYNDRFASGEKVKYPVVILNNETTIQNYFCPEDECQKHVLTELNKARRSIYFMTFSFTDSRIAKILVEKNNESIDVKGVFEKQRWNNQYEVYKYLNQSGVKLIPDNNKYIMHHKTFIIDNETVITGSYNPTGSGNKNNDENIIIIKDKEITKQYLKEFERLIN